MSFALNIESDTLITEPYRAVLDKGIRLPVQPKVLIEFQDRVSSADYDIRDLAKIVGRDPAIVAALFRVAGSPVFHCPKKCESIEQVMMILGAKQTHSLILAIALTTSIAGGSKKSFEIFWQRSQDIARLASLIAADRVAICNIFPEQAYLAGIFLESGSAVLMQRFPDYSKQLALENNFRWPALAEEDALFNVDHCSIGYLIARHWKLPEFICRTIQYHHEMPSEELGAVRTLVAILHLAIHFYNLSSGLKDTVWDNIGKDVLSELGIDPQGERAYYDEVIERFLV